MFFNSITFKDSATPFAEALVELHHEIMFYLVVIVSVVIFILINAINITRVRESYFYVNIFSSVGFLKAALLNTIFFPAFNKFLYSSYYSRFYSWIINTLTDLVYIIATKGSSYLTYLLRLIMFVKSLSLNFLSVFSKLESFVAKLFGDYSNLGYKNLFPNSIVSNGFFYKTRNSSSYLMYLSNIISYLSIISIFNDLDYKNFYKNREFLFTHFYNLSKESAYKLSSRSIVNSLDLNSLENLYSYNKIPQIVELNSHFSVFFSSFLKNKFNFSNSLYVSSFNRLSPVDVATPRSLYSFINAQSYTVHNTKLEII